MTKFTEPIRLGVTIGIVPTIARWFGRRAAAEHDVKAADGKQENKL